MLANPSSSPTPSRAQQRHWRSSLRLIMVLLVAWLLLSLGCGVWFAAELNRFHLGGFPLGFWFAHQGTILGFVGIVWLYAAGMQGLDRRLQREEQE